MEEIKFSVIIPVYNVERFLKQSLNSVINQTLKEIEIIIINDGSTDGSIDIINEFLSKDYRIQLINQDNAGQSIARNRGIDIAKGKWIYFLDSDDYIEENTFEIAYDFLKNKMLDILFFDGESFFDGDFKKKRVVSNKRYIRSGLLNNEVFKGEDVLEVLLKKNKYTCSPCLFFINRDYIERSSLKFYPKIIHEDELFTFKAFLFSERISYLNKAFFKRRIRFNSTMTATKNEKNLKGYLTVVKELKKILVVEESYLKRRLLKKRINDLITTTIGVLIYLKKNSQNKYIEEIKTTFAKEINLKNKILIKNMSLVKIIKVFLDRFIGR